MKFNIRRQEEGEPVDSFNIVGFTGYQNIATIIQDEMIRYQIIVGLPDSNLSDKLQTDPELTLIRQ